MSEEITKRVEALYEEKLSSIRASIQSYRDEIRSKIDLRKKDVNRESITKTEVSH